jgi:hypothetical protein
MAVTSYSTSQLPLELLTQTLVDGKLRLFSHLARFCSTSSCVAKFLALAVAPTLGGGGWCIDARIIDPGM